MTTSTAKMKSMAMKQNKHIMIKDCNKWSITEPVQTFRYLNNTISNMREVDMNNKISNFSKINQII